MKLPEKAMIMEDDTMKERYHISGMTCSACSAHVEKAVNKLEGMEKASVNLLTETMEAVYKDGALSSLQIIAAVEKAGYGAELIGEKRGTPAGHRDVNTGGSGANHNGKTDNSGRAAADRGSLQSKAREEARAMRWRLGISIAFLLPLMYVAMYHMYYEDRKSVV